MEVLAEFAADAAGLIVLADANGTILHSLGVNPKDQVRDGFGRLVPLSTGQVRRPLFEG